MRTATLTLTEAEESNGFISFKISLLSGEKFPAKSVPFSTTQDLEREARQFLEEVQPNYQHGLACFVRFPKGTRKPNGFDKSQVSQYLTSFPSAQPQPTQQKYIFFEDPGHGWLQVERRELQELGILGKITSCSYQKGGYVYLEEDCDLATFFTAKGWKSWADGNIETIRQDPTPIRNYRPFSI